ncbi:MAG: hypothetical protein V4807_12120 [Burkholderia gladioli]
MNANFNRFAGIRNRLTARVNAALNAAETRIETAVTDAENEIATATAAMELSVTNATISAVEQITAMGAEISAGIAGDESFRAEDTEADQQAFQAGDVLPFVKPAVPVAATEAAGVRALLNAGAA